MKSQISDLGSSPDGQIDRDSNEPCALCANIAEAIVVILRTYPGYPMSGPKQTWPLIFY